MRQQRRPKVTYKVVWLGKNPEYMYQKMFPSQDAATRFSEKVENSMVYKVESFDKKLQAAKLRLIETDEAKKFLRAVKMSRRIEHKKQNLFSKMTGGDEVAVVSTTEYRKSQRGRLVNTLVFAPIFYAGYKLKDSETKWLGYALMGIAGLTALHSGKTFLANRKIK